jgi:hypothetical protein
MPRDDCRLRRSPVPEFSEQVSGRFNIKLAAIGSCHSVSRLLGIPFPQVSFPVAAPGLRSRAGHSRLASGLGGMNNPPRRLQRDLLKADTDRNGWTASQVIGVTRAGSPRLLRYERSNSVHPTSTSHQRVTCTRRLRAACVIRARACFLRGRLERSHRQDAVVAVDALNNCYRPRDVKVPAAVIPRIGTSDRTAGQPERQRAVASSGSTGIFQT